ncbi:putative zinc-binding metallopeptidase [Arthrobacter sp. PL16]|uniref:putative zinc-binding metallopeptidase n=1 Tax=Arthrobacter sp. PL16 TaxID=3071720 RepID=UPI002E0E80F7
MDAIKRHYDEGAPECWEKEHISMYATMHPHENFAETFAHYLHICDTVHTAPAVVAKLDFVHKLRVRVGEPVEGTLWQ